MFPCNIEDSVLSWGGVWTAFSRERLRPDICLRGAPFGADVPDEAEVPEAKSAERVPNSGFPKEQHGYLCRLLQRTCHYWKSSQANGRYGSVFFEGTLV